MTTKRVLILLPVVLIGVLIQSFFWVPTYDKQAAGNSLYENLGDGTFRDATRAIGGLPGGWAFGGGFVDFDNDGWEDLYTPNGFVSGKSMKDT